MDPNAEGPLYCADQIKIPAELPNILKEYTKAAIRTQPTDVLQWSAAYFQALHNGDVPPIKARLEQDLPSREERLGGLTKGCLAVLHSQLGSNEIVAVTNLQDKWKSAGCDQSKLDELLVIGDMSDEVEWLKLLALACTALEKSLPDALTTLCKIVSPDLEGGPARIPVEKFRSLYGFLAYVDGEITKEHVASVMEFLTTESNRYDGNIGPRDFLHPSCPRLDSKRH